jgi:hypothetical protein
MKALINAAYVNDKEHIAMLSKDYFNLPDEYAATMWAVNFANKNIDKLWTLRQKLQPAIMNFYMCNNITED